MGVRFYKSATNTGQHRGSLWAADGSTAGSLLATGVAVNETVSGWQQVIFPTPVPVQGLTTYVASYFAPAGHYAGDANFFATANVDNPPLHALATGVDGPNGVFTYSATTSYPSSTFGGANYWVDLIFAPSTTYTLRGIISGAGGANATVILSGTVSATTTADANGNYSFNGLSNGTYTVAPKTPGYNTSPSTQTVTVSAAHLLYVNFTAAVPTFPVSGTVSGAPGTTLTLSGSVSQTAVVDASGAYVFAAVPVGTYTMTPGAAGFTFTPANTAVTVSSAPVTNLNFTATAVTYSISGGVSGGSGATILLNGRSSGSTVADSSGNYTVSGLIAGNYTVVPVLAHGSITSPSNLTLTLSNANIVGANFTVPSTCPCDTIFQPQAVPGSIDFGDGNATEVGVKFKVAADAYIAGVRFYKAPLNAGTHLGRIWDSSGNLLGTVTFVSESASGWQQAFFSTPIAVTANTVYTASYFAPAGHYAADVGYFLNSGVSNPPLQALANGAQGANGVYVASATGGFPSLSFNSNATNYWVDVIDTPSSTYTIAGTIAGVGGPGASVALTGGSPATVTADTSGNFSLSGVANGTYTVTPAKSGYVYTPASLQVTVNNGHALRLGFTSSAIATYTLSGVITGPGSSGSTVTLSGSASATLVTPASGAFSLPGLPNGSYVATASRAGFLYTPASQTVAISNANKTASFTSAVNAFILSGTLSGAGGAAATVTLSGAATATTTSNTSGVYSFSAVANGSYGVTPAKAGYSFTPVSRTIALSGANGTASFTSMKLTYSLSGTISGAGGAGATVTLGGTATASAVASTSGTFSFAGLSGGNYTVIVSRAGYTFSPASQAVTIASANVATTFTSVATPHVASNSR